MLIASVFSLGAGAVVAALVTHHRLAERLFPRAMLRSCLTFPRTSSFAALENTPITRIRTRYPRTDEEKEAIVAALWIDSNLKQFALCATLSATLRALFADEQELLLQAMDAVVLSQRGVEVLIVEFEAEEKRAYDRSLSLDLAELRTSAGMHDRLLAMVCGLLAFVVLGLSTTFLDS